MPLSDDLWKQQLSPGNAVLAKVKNTKTKVICWVPGKVTSVPEVNSEYIKTSKFMEKIPIKVLLFGTIEHQFKRKDLIKIAKKLYTGLVKYANMINKTENKNNVFHQEEDSIPEVVNPKEYTETLLSSKIMSKSVSSSKSSSLSKKSKSTALSNKSKTKTSSSKSPYVKSVSSLTSGTLPLVAKKKSFIQTFAIGDRVLFEHEDGWFYEGFVSGAISSSLGFLYKLQSRGNYLDKLFTTESLLNCQPINFNSELDKGFALALHPNYTDSFCPAKIIGNKFVTDVMPKLMPKDLNSFVELEEDEPTTILYLEVVFYDGQKDLVLAENCTSITDDQYERISNLIFDKEIDLVGKEVVAKDDNLACFQTGQVLGILRKSSQPKYQVKWSDDRVSTVDINWIFPKHQTTRNDPKVGAWLLVKTKSRTTNLSESWEPGWLVSRSDSNDTVEVMLPNKRKLFGINKKDILPISRVYFDSILSYLRDYHIEAST